MLEAIEDLARRATESDRAAGMVVAVASGDQLDCQAYGWADLQDRRPVVPDTIFRIGSITKLFTAALVLSLAEREQISLDDEISRYLGEVALHDAAGEPVRVTIGQLLHHIAGVHEYVVDPEFGEHVRRGGLSLPRMIEFIVARPVEFAPGTRFAYSNSGFVLLGALLERVTAKPYAELVEQLATRAGLADLRVCSDDPTSGREACGYSLHLGALLRSPKLQMLGAFAAGSLCGTATDLVMWMRALTHERVIGDAMFRSMCTPLVLPDGTVPPYGMGLMIDRVHEHWRIGHPGGISGFSSHLGYFGEEFDELTIAVLTNTDTANAVELADQIAGLLLPGVDHRAVSAGDDSGTPSPVSRK